MNTIKECCNELNVLFVRNEISRAHRIGKINAVDEVDRCGNKKKSKEKTQSIIVKFKDWEPRTALYKARPRFEPGSKSKPKFTISVDLSRYRYSLLQLITEKIDHVKYCFADVNCNLGLRTADNKLCFFYYIESLEELITDWE